MVTSVLIERDRAAAPWLTNRLGGCDSRQALIVQCRKAMARVQAFVDDPAQVRTSLGSLDRSADESSAMARRGLGTAGLFTAFAPGDPGLYEALVPAPLRMPRAPEVLFQLVDHNTGQDATRYQESFLFLRVTCPDGREAWYMASVAVPSEIMCIMGLAWGLPKYLADEITVGPGYGEVRYEGRIRLAATFEADAAAQSRIAGRDFGVGEDAVRLNPSTRHGLVAVGRSFAGIEVVERTAGWVTVVPGDNEPLAPLFPAERRLPGAWQRYLPGSWTLWKY